MNQLYKMETFGSITSKTYTATYLSDSEQTQITENLNKLELAIKDSQNSLDLFITEKQVEEKLNNPKPKKSNGIEGILNEMLKQSSKKI